MGVLWSGRNEDTVASAEDLNLPGELDLELSVEDLPNVAPLTPVGRHVL
jgi:hypothetical protein